MKHVSCAFAALLVAFSSTAQHHHGATAPTPQTSCTAPVTGPVPAEVLRRAVPLRKGLGAVHEPVTATSTEAQALYDQGLAYLHGYVWIEAARSFHEALRQDPNLVMAHVGLARVHMNLKDKPAARFHAEKAKALASTVSPREKLRIDAQLAQVAAVEVLGDEKLHQAYRAALDAALAADIDNPEVWLLRGNAEESSASGIGQQGKVQTIGYYESAMKRAPDHPAPYHYLVHTYENLGQFQAATQQGERYASLSPQIPHALHMYGHDLMKTGRMPEAIDFFTRADALERAYYGGESISPDLDWHHAHNLSLLGMSHRYLGQHSRAEELFREISALDPFLDEFAFMYKIDLASHLLARGRAAEVLQIPNAKKTTMERAFGAIFEGRALVLAGRIDEARKAKERAIAEMPEVAKAMPEWPGFATFLTQAYIDLLDGMILYERDDTREAAREKLQGFVSTVRNAFTGPDEWIAGLYDLEAIARTAVRKKDWEFAKKIAGQLNDHDSNYPGTLYVQALIAEQAGDAATARTSFAAAAKGWANADPGFEDLKTARQNAMP